jgi:hypothetical protein
MLIFNKSNSTVFRAPRYRNRNRIFIPKATPHTPHTRPHHSTPHTPHTPIPASPHAKVPACLQGEDSCFLPARWAKIGGVARLKPCPDLGCSKCVHSTHFWSVENKRFVRHISDCQAKVCVSHRRIDFYRIAAHDFVRDISICCCQSLCHY